ncbi:MAG: ATP-binding protein [Phycisphaerales bacterium JB064]
MPTRARYDHMHVILIDDNDDHLHLMKSSVGVALKNVCKHIDFHLYDSAADAMAEIQLMQAEDDSATVVICDYQLDAHTATDWLNDFVRVDLGPIIIATASGNEEAAAAVLRAGAADYISKSKVFVDREALGKTILEALRRYEVECSTVQLSRKLKKANSELAVKGRRLEIMSETAHRFVEDVAHDFRTPLAVIQEFASIMRDGLGGPVSEKNMEFLGQITNATRDLAQLVDDFLDAGKLQAGTLRVDRRPVFASEVLDGIWTMLQMRAKNAHITLERHVDHDMPPIFVDVDKSRRAIINLVVNAIKFSPIQSTVSVAVTHEEDMVRVSITDHGSGLDKDSVKTMFERFKQANTYETFGAKGFGLGLSIVAQLVHLNLGKVEVESEPGVGSTFSVLFPVATPEAILPRFMKKLAKQDSHDKITVLEVTCPHCAERPDQLRSYLGSVSRAWDLTVPASSGNGFLVIGQSDDAEGWVTRLKNQPWGMVTNGDSDQPGGLQCNVLGQWPVDQALEKVQPLVPSLGGETHVAHSPHR